MPIFYFDTKNTSRDRLTVDFLKRHNFFEIVGFHLILDFDTQGSN